MRRPIFSTVQKLLVRAFFSSKSSITIFTEDKNSDVIFYTNLLSRLENKLFKINKIVPLGPRSEVFARSLSSYQTKNPSLFIVDGDIDLLLGTRFESPNLISLDRYCIENYLCCENGISALYMNKKGISRDASLAQLDFGNFIFRNCKGLIKLQILYAISMHNDCGVTFKKVDDFLRNSPVREVDPAKIAVEISIVTAQIKAHLRLKGIKAYSREFENQYLQIASLCPSNLNSAKIFLSGKTHLLPLIRLRLIALEGSFSSFSNDDLKRFLAEKVDISSLSFIQKKVLKILDV